MPLTPGYGETPVSEDEADALLPQARELLGKSITRADLYDLEQAVQEEVVEELVTVVLDRTLSVDDMLLDQFVRDLHRRLYGDIWTWPACTASATRTSASRRSRSPSMSVRV